MFELLVTTAVLGVLGVTGGQQSSEPSVVAVLDEMDHEVCSGVAIDAHIILTAASCVPTAVKVYFGVGQALAPGSLHDVVGVRRHPNAAVDLALLLINPGAGQTPAQRAIEPLRPAMVARLIGFGHTTDDTSAHLKREATMGVFATTPTTLELGGVSGQTSCDGDTGGGVFGHDNVLHGIISSTGISSTGASCHQTVVATRITMVPVEFDEFIAATRPGVVPVGGRCWYAANCAAGLCFQHADQGFPYCSTACTTTDQCPSDLSCEFSQCVHGSPSPGAIGAACGANVDCYSQLCDRASGDDVLVCSQRCTPGKGQCPTGFACATDFNQDNACFAAPAQGCSCNSTTATDGVWLLALVVLLCVRRRANGAC